MFRKSFFVLLEHIHIENLNCVILKMRFLEKGCGGRDMKSYEVLSVMCWLSSICEPINKL